VFLGASRWPPQIVIRYPAMSFRQPKSNRAAEDHAWREWLRANEPALKRAGLPPSVMMSAAHWYDFVQNGHLEWHQSDGFSFGELSSEQMAILLDVLELSLKAAPEYTGPMIGWLRVRLSRPAAG
jgi:hypothetical protein